MRYPQPSNEDAFEDFCLELLSEYWACETLQRYGKRGERQHGVDILDMGGEPHLRCVQCKNHEPHKYLPPKELKAEVKKAKSFPGEIKEYFILTTGKKSAHAQNAVRKINEEHQKDRLFRVHLWSWDEIEKALEKCPGAQALLLPQPDPSTQAISVQSRPERVVQPQQRERDVGTEGELDEVKVHLDSGELQLAELLLARAKGRNWDSYGPSLRRRWDAQKAEIFIRRGDYATAAQHLLQASRELPNEEKSLANGIVAMELLGRFDEAYELAKAAISEHPASAELYGALCRTAPDRETYRRLFADCPSGLAAAANFLLGALGRRDFGAEPEFDEKLARRCTLAASDSPHGWYTLGALLVQLQVARLVDNRSIQPEKLGEAVEALTEAARLAEAKGAVPSVAGALTQRASAHALLGKIASAREDLVKARVLEPNNPQVTVAYGRLEAQAGDVGRAIDLFREAIMREDDGEARFLLSAALWKRNLDGDRSESVNIVVELSKLDSPIREVALERAIDGLLLLKKHDEALKLLKDVQEVPEATLAILRAVVLRVLERKTEATHAASCALKVANEDLPSHFRRRLARELSLLGRERDALEVWRSLLVAGEVNDDLRLAVQSAAALGEDKTVMGLCKKARAAGAWEDFLLHHELRLLREYDQDAAVDLLKELVERQPENVAAAINLALLAVEREDISLAEAQIAAFPEVGDVELMAGVGVVQVLVRLKKIEEALLYSYDLHRRFFREPEAHRAFINALTARLGKDDGEPTPMEVAPGTAVRIVEGQGEGNWYVLEDSPVGAEGVEHELSRSDALWEKLIGRKVGEEVVLSEGAGLKRAAIVKDVIPKRVFRARDVWNNWQLRFDSPGVWMIDVSSKKGEGEFDFSSLMEMVKARRDQETARHDYYRQNAVPIGAIAIASGRDEVQILGELVSDPTRQVKCCRGLEEDYSLADLDLAVATEVVADITALTTLAMLEEIETLKRLGKALVVGPAAIAKMRELRRDSRSVVGSVGSLGTTDEGEPQIEVGDSEAQKVRAAKMAHFVELLESECTIVGCPELAELPEKDREQLERLLGRSALESAVLVGTKSGRILWTDDGIAALLCRERFATSRVWTQVFLKWSAAQGLMAYSAYQDASISLVGWGYSFSQIDVPTLIRAAERSEWDASRAPLRLLIACLHSVAPEGAAVLATTLIARSCMVPIEEEQSSKLIQAVVKSLQEHPQSEVALREYRALLDLDDASQFGDRDEQSDDPEEEE